MSSPNESFHVILAEKKHDDMMREILQDSAFSGKISLSYLREPSVFESFQQEGKSYIFLLMRADEQAVGMGALTIREVMLDGKAVRLGYLSSLRIRPAYQKQFLHMAAMYQRMYEMTQNEVDLYLTTILAENETAQRLFEKKRRSMPEYRRVAYINTYFAGYKKGSDLPPAGLYNADDDGMPLNTLPGACYMQHEGVIGYTLENNMKVYKVNAYQGVYRLIPYLPLSRLGLPRFPRPGDKARYLAAGVYVREASKQNIAVMVQALRNQAKGYDFVMLAALQGSALDEVLSEQPGVVRYQSILYEVLFDGAAPHDLGAVALDVALL